MTTISRGQRTRLTHDESRMMGHGETDAGTVKYLEGTIKETLDYWEALLAKQQYLSGDVCDVTMLAVRCLDLLLISFVESLAR